MEGGSKNLYCHGGGVISKGMAIRLGSEKLYCHGGGVQNDLLPWRGGRKSSIAMEGGAKMTYCHGGGGPEILGEVMGEWVIPRVG